MSEEDLREMFCRDHPTYAEARYGGGDLFPGSLVRSQVETDETIGSRSVFTAAASDLQDLRQGDRIEVDGIWWKAGYIERTGRYSLSVVLSQV